MARFYGKVGFNEGTVETRPGVMEEVIVERDYYGDLLRNSRTLQEVEQKVNGDITINNSVSIVADEYLNEHFFNIRYVRWSGAYWTVSEVTVQRPRLVLRLGGMYNGNKA